MFNLQGSEIIIILLLALVVLGPEKLPEAMRKAGKLYADVRKMSSGFQDEFRAAMDEPIREVRETANMLRDSADFTALADGERDQKQQADGCPGGQAAETMPTSVEVDDDDDDELDVDPSVGAGEGLAAPAGQTPVDITKPKAQNPPPPPPPFTGSNTLGPTVVDDTAASAPSATSAATEVTVQDGSIPTPPAPFSGTTTLGLGSTSARDANAAATPVAPDAPVAPAVTETPAVPPPPATSADDANGDRPAVPPAPAPQPGAEDAPA